MKKGVRSLSSHILFNLACLTFILLIIPFVFGGGNENPGGDSSAPNDYDSTSSRDEPIKYDNVPGYWIAIDSSTGHTYGGDNVFYMPRSGDGPLHIGDSGVLVDIYSKLVFTPNAEGDHELDLKDLYDKFNVPEGVEIQWVRFVLDPMAFSRDDITSSSKEYFGSHSTDPSYGWSETAPCVTCENIDELGYCDPASGKDYTCASVDIINRNDCTAMADYNQPFCEGVVGVGGNAPDIDPGSISNPGKGGCQPSEGFNAVTVSGYHAGRDWYDEFETGEFETEGYDFFSDDIKFSSVDRKEEVGRCCGNDPQDVGAVAKPATEYGAFPNSYMCINDTRDSFKGSMLWGYAQENDMLYKIISLERLGAKYDVVSNSNNWYVCDTGYESIEGWYEPVSFKDNGKREGGILLQEYEMLPIPGARISESTEVLGGGSDSDLEDGPFSSVDDDVDSGSFSNEIVEADVFSTAGYDVGGTAAVTACDKDGDGYDGQWSPDPSAGVWYDSSGTCRNPRQPYDCDDDSSDDSIPGLARMTHPGRLDYCINGEDYNLDCAFEPGCIDIPDPDGSSSDMFENPAYEFLNPRFICHNEDHTGSFAECCGWDLGYCFNFDKGRREGAALHTLREFDSYGTVLEGSEANINKTNFVLRFGIKEAPGKDKKDQVLPDATYQLALFDNNNDLEIKEWSDYKNLEFYIWYTANFELELWVGQYAGGEGGSESFLEYYVFPFKARITDYIVNEPELRKWLHVVIPTEDIFPVDYDPDVILFSSNVHKLIDLGTTVSIPSEPGKTFSNIVGIDKIFLRPNAEEIPGGDVTPEDNNNMYCSGTWPPVWITDLDDNTIPLNAASDRGAGQDACESIPSYGWTGTMCCGDDTGRDTEPGKIGPATFKEFYADTTSGCWAGNVLPDNSRIMLVTYGMQYHGTGGEEVKVNRSCKNATCIYDLPPVPNILITNENHEVYDLAFLSDGDPSYKPIGVGSLSPSSSSLLLAENVPMQVLYLKGEGAGADGEFWSCNGGDLVHSLEDTIKSVGSPLVPESNRLTSEGSTCTIKGGYFCDHIDGANLGWNDETLEAYPDPTVEEVDGHKTYALTVDDEGNQEDLAVGTLVPPTRRILTKTTYNMIKNGGFENV